MVSSLNLGEYSNNTGNQFWACDFERSDLATAQVDEPTHATALPTFIILSDRTCMADPVNRPNRLPRFLCPSIAVGDEGLSNFEEYHRVYLE